MRHWRTAFPLLGAILVLGVFAGVCDPPDGSDRHLRGSRIRSPRAARIDIDHEAADQAQEMLSGTAAVVSGSELPPKLRYAEVAVRQTQFSLQQFEWLFVALPEPLTTVYPLASRSRGPPLS
jgi:hypothetical protein